MGKKRWVGLRSASFRKTLLVVGLIVLFCIGVWFGKHQQISDSKQVELLEKQVKLLEGQINQLKEATKNTNLN
ncbi:MAG TPA: hypothetical protein VFF14_08420 [Candidatus Deferrimicrobium sp.]|nr:hypothetical protein [Candidatus Deferrimicrobium sp.]